MKTPYKMLRVYPETLKALKAVAALNNQTMTKYLMCLVMRELDKERANGRV